VAAWAAHGRADWAQAVDSGLTLTLAPAGADLFAFGHFPAGLRTELGLERRGAEDREAGLAGVEQELERSGRVIVAGDGFNLPWHVARGRVHVPHWFVLVAAGGGIEVLDPFACRNELGTQQAARVELSSGELPALIAALPPGDEVFELRERMALGDELSLPSARSVQWYEQATVQGAAPRQRAAGPAALLLLADHFRTRGQEERAYDQADDLWSIARHRSFLARNAARRSGDPSAEEWVREHAEPLARRWGHVAPLLMQARLALRAGRPASASVPEKFEELAGLEQAAAREFPYALGAGSI
jgi:hypothetical protein